MPDSPSPFDDPFADLFGKLPDPRERRGRGRRRSRGTAEARDRRARVHGLPAGPAPDDPTRRLAKRRLVEAAASRAVARPTAAATRPQAAPTAAPAPVARRGRRHAPTDDRSPKCRPSDAPSVSVTSVDDEPRIVRAAARRIRVVSATGGTAVARSATTSAAATATLEDLFTGEHTSDSLGRCRRRRTSASAGSAAGSRSASSCSSSAVSQPAACGCGTPTRTQIRELMGWEEPKDYEAGLANGEALVTIASGDTGSRSRRRSYNAGVTKTPEAFYDYLIDTGQNPPFVPGVFKLQKQMTSAAALDRAAGPREQAGEHRAAARGSHGRAAASAPRRRAPGSAGGLPGGRREPADYGVDADSLEGWLFPATYTFDPGVTATRRDHRRSSTARSSRSMRRACPWRTVSGCSRSRRSSSARRGSRPTSTRSRGSSRTA